MKRTTLMLDEVALDEVLRLSGERTFSAAVDRALREFILRARAGRILDLAGSGLWEGDLAKMREDWAVRDRGHVAHGDLSNPKHQGYRIFRRLLKNRWSYGLIDRVGPRLARNVARRLSEISYRRSHESALRHSPPAFRAFAHRKFMEGFDVVILGHSHFPEEAEERIDGRKCLYFNVGDWALRRSFLRFTPPDRFRLERFEERTGD